MSEPGEVARAEVTFPRPTLCPRRFLPGMVRRSGVGRNVIGYWLTCPACKSTRSYLHDEARFIESIPGFVLTGMTRPVRCTECLRPLTLVREAGLLYLVALAGPADT